MSNEETFIEENLVKLDKNQESVANEPPPSPHPILPPPPAQLDEGLTPGKYGQEVGAPLPSAPNQSLASLNGRGSLPTFSIPSNSRLKKLN